MIVIKALEIEPYFFIEWIYPICYNVYMNKGEKDMHKIGFLGLGKMGSSILNGILTKGLYGKEDILFYAPSKETQEKYTNIGIHLADNESDLVLKSSIIVLAVKPQKYDEIMSKVKSINCEEKVIISLAPGKSIDYLSKSFTNANIVRAMPNTPALVNHAVTTIAFSKGQVKEVTDIFSSIGTYVILEEKQIDEAIPLNGSMPAYIFEFVKAFVESAKEYGLDSNDAFKLALNSIIGSCELALNSSDDIDTLINNVCSKGGSTKIGRAHV